ncbi:glycoside hydrolase family 15 protein [Nocardioides sp. URHA0032]|uniref:glycoside hydrolase family 15 protein n=1 Tax=Nocardioides sp. URHA0032 TaxID=1380388 RepID=UPI00055CF380|nr:glycoside hydrolase family 15 protein [Nocardioides sp. URHA0032]
MTRPITHPVTLRQYALVADGERGALIGPRGDLAFMCAPRWHDDAVFSSLLGGRGEYTVSPIDRRFVWGGHYEQDSLVWRSRWVTTRSVIESREALAFPGDPGHAVLMRRVEAHEGDAYVHVTLDCRAGFGTRAMTVCRRSSGAWEGRTGDLSYRWSGATEHARLDDDRLALELVVPAGESRDLVLELGTGLADELPDPDHLWARTEQAWRDTAPDLTSSAAPGDARHSWAVLRGLTSGDGGMVAAATTSLPERAEAGRNYDYRYAWIRDQCYTGQAAAVAGAHDLLDAAVRFVTERVLADGPDLKPAYRVAGGRVPDQRRLPLPGYPGAPVQVGNHVNEQFQLDALGEALLLFAAADRVDRLDRDAHDAVQQVVAAIEKRHTEPDAGIWELEDRRWAHSRLICAAGLRAVGRGEEADRLVASVDADCLHSSGRWQRSPDDPLVDAALLLPGIRGAVPADDPRHVRTWRAVVDELTDDGYVYRFRHDPELPMHQAEGAFVLSGFHLSLASLGQGRVTEAARWFERNRGSLGPPGLFTEEFDVVERQLRGNLPQAFVHALLLETAHELGRAGVGVEGFAAEDR